MNEHACRGCGKAPATAAEFEAPDAASLPPVKYSATRGPTLPVANRIRLTSGPARRFGAKNIVACTCESLSAAKPLADNLLAANSTGRDRGRRCPTLASHETPLGDVGDSNPSTCATRGTQAGIELSPPFLSQRPGFSVPSSVFHVGSSCPVFLQCPLLAAPISPRCARPPSLNLTFACALVEE